jgi:hypothetical protein
VERPAYSPERRTALVLCGTGAHGVYHAGVLRALEEAGVKIDVVAGHGVGAASAALAAIDGAAKLWTPNGIWRGPHVRSLYGWRWPLRAAAWLFLPLVVTLLARFILIARGTGVPSVLLFAPTAVTVVIVLVLAAGLAVARWRAPVERRTVGRWWWRLLGAPIDAGVPRTLFARALWDLIRGAAPIKPPDARALGRRYVEVLSEGLGQPGFRELMMVVTDVDTRSDIVAAMLREPYRREFIARRAGRERQAEILDFAGLGRDHVLDVVAGALTLPLGTDPHLVTFGHDSYWRGETHRLCDRPGSVARLLDELAVAGVTQAVVVSAVPVTSDPHRLRASRLELRQRLGELVSVSEAAARRDAIDSRTMRLDAVYLICPAHNPVGPFDFGGAYDEASDRHQTLDELMERAYEDAYRQFIDPVVAASGEQLGTLQQAPPSGQPAAGSRQ